MPAAHSGTGFTANTSSLTWSTGAATSSARDLLELVVRQTQEGVAAARAAGRTVNLKSVLRRQGENKSSMTTSADSTQLDKFIAFFRTWLAASKQPFVGQLTREGIGATPGKANIDRNHRETPARVEHTSFVHSKAGTLNSGT